MKRFIFIAFGFLAFAFYELSGGSSFDPETTRQAAQEVRQDLEASRSAAIQDRMTALPPVSGRAPVPAIPSDEQGDQTSELDLVSFSSAAAPERGALPTIAQEPSQDTPDTNALSDGSDSEAAPEIAEEQTQPATGTNAAAQTPEPAQLPSITETVIAETPDPAPVEDAEQTEVQPNKPATIRLSRLPTIQPEDDSLNLSGLSATASSDNVTPPEDFRIVSGTRVNLREGPGIRYDVVGQLSRDTRVEVVEDAGNGWVRLRRTDGSAAGWVAEFLLIDG